MYNQFNLPKFRDATLFQQAMTHRSYFNEHPEVKLHNERLEFLGDAVLNFLCGEFLYRQYPDKPEGELTSLRSALVDEQQLAQFALWLDLGQWLKLGKGAEKEGGRYNANLLSSAFEAMIGAYFLDTHSDVDCVRVYVEPLFIATFEYMSPAFATLNFKSRLQEWALSAWQQTPAYLIVEQSGPNHAREFTAEVQVAGRIYGQGKGRRKQDAEKCAARAALQALGLIQD
jgi:ribonuclease-3